MMTATLAATLDTSQEILAAIANLAAGATTITTKTHTIATTAVATSHRGANALATPTAAGTRESAMTVATVQSNHRVQVPCYCMEPRDAACSATTYATNSNATNSNATNSSLQSSHASPFAASSSSPSLVPPHVVAFKSPLLSSPHILPPSSFDPPTFVGCRYKRAPSSSLSARASSSCSSMRESGPYSGPWPER